MDTQGKTIINNTYDYSNIVPTIEAISYLIEYCDQTYKDFSNLINEDEEKNKQFKLEFKKYMYKKTISQAFRINIRPKDSFNVIFCDSYEQFISAIKGDSLKEVDALKIELCLNFSRGMWHELEEHKNEFKISFEPYNIKFKRESNYTDSNMDSVEQQINSILKKFPVANSIFCNKSN